MNTKEALEHIIDKVTKNADALYRLKLIAVYLQEYEVAANLSKKEKELIQLKKWQDEINNKE